MTKFATKDQEKQNSMKILKITKNIKETENLCSLYRDHGLFYDFLSPTPLSAFTSIKISNQLKKSNFDIIEVENTKDALAAISALKLSDDKKPKISFKPKPNSDTPRSIVSEIKEKIDTWIFPSVRLKQLYPDELKNVTVIPTVPPADFTPTQAANADKPRISWIGDIKDAARIKKVIDIFDESETEFILTICGAGSAREVMPAVRLSREVRRKKDISWKGEEYKLDKEAGDCDAIIKTQNDITPIEYKIRETGKKIIDIDDIIPFVEAKSKNKEYKESMPDIELIKSEEAASKLAQHYNNIR